MKDNSTEKAIKASIKYHKQCVQQGNDDLAEARGRRLLQCGACSIKSPARKWVVFQKEYYISPHGCSSGDYWRDGEKDINCPKCGTWNRCIFKHGKSVAKKYADSMIENDPYRGEDVPGEWVNL